MCAAMDDGLSSDVDSAGRSPLHRAAAAADVTQVQQLLSFGTLPPAFLEPDKAGDGPLHHAARAGSAECVRALLAAAPDRAAMLDAQSKKGDTALILAACHGHAALAALLVAAGADEALTTRNGWDEARWAADWRKQEAKRAAATAAGSGAGGRRVAVFDFDQTLATIDVSYFGKQGVEAMGGPARVARLDEMLTRLSAAGVELGICSFNSRDTVVKTLRLAALLRHFEAPSWRLRIFGCDEFEGQSWRKSALIEAKFLHGQVEPRNLLFADDSVEVCDLRAMPALPDAMCAFAAFLC